MDGCGVREAQKPLFKTEGSGLSDAGKNVAIGILVKTVNPTTVSAPRNVTYSYKVTNTGNVTLTALLLTDDKAGAITLAATTLAPGASTTGTKVFAINPWPCSMPGHPSLTWPPSPAPRGPPLLPRVAQE